MSRWTNKRVAVAYGGDSSEREVSLKTGAAIVRALRNNGHQPIEIDLTRAALGELLAAKPDVVFIAMHGREGEGGPLQGLLELMGVPYTGSGVTASAAAIDKVMAKRLFANAGVPTPRWAIVAPGTHAPPAGVGLPCVLKPSLEGSSVGVVFVNEASEWTAGLAECLSHPGEALMEETVVGRELSSVVFEGEYWGTVEIAPADGFYDYESKYLRGDTNYRVPANLTDAEHERVIAAALAAYRVVGCRGVARVDMMVGDDGAPKVLEVNTVPGMTETSLVPKAAEARGVSFDELVGRILDAATTDALEIERRST